MKMLMGSLAVSLGIMSSGVSAEVMLNVNGTEYTLSALMENCQSMTDPTGQVACFNAVSALLEDQTSEPAASTAIPVPQALEALRSIAQHEDAESGLIIQGEACNAQIIYYANYFHISRRNVSSIDLFSVQYDMSQVDFANVAQTTGGAPHMSRGAMYPGAVATTAGGLAIDSAQNNLAPKPGRMSISDYALEVAPQLPTTQSGTFDFVLVHPAKQQFSADIWAAFEAYAKACQS